MIPKIIVNTDKDTFTSKEVEKMVQEIQDTFESIIEQQARQYAFAKRISYLSLIVAALLIGKELFL